MFNWKGKEKKKTNLEMQEPDRYYNQVLALKNQKKINLSLLVIIGLLVVLLGKITFFYHTKVLVIEKDHNNYTYLGSVRNLAKTNFQPKDTDLVYFLNKVVEKMRYIPADKIVLGKNRQDLNFFLSSKAKKKLVSIDNDTGITELHKKGSVIDIEPLSSIRLSENTFQLRWIEKVYDIKGQQIAENVMVGAFEFEIDVPNSEKVILVNPIGLIIKDFSIKTEN